MAAPTPPAQPRKDAELFVHLRLETRGTAPWMANPDVAQAAETVLAMRARQHRCRVLAIGSGDDHLHVVFSFPASMPLNQLIRLMQHVSGAAAARALMIQGVPDVPPETIWSGRYQLDTLSQGDVAGLVAYVCRHPSVHAAGAAQPEYEHSTAGPGAERRLPRSYVVRERPHRYLVP